MRPSLDHRCPACGATFIFRGAQAFLERPCPACGKSSRPREAIGGYRLFEPLARSGLGVIFRAVDASGAPLAVKVLQPPLAAVTADLDYFVSEVWAQARLNHPHCLRIFATGVAHGAAWIAMEWLERGSLAARLAARGRLREAEVLAIGIQAASALGAAHAAGHVHRDLEPNNLLFADAHTIKVSDFGQAALYQIIGDDLGAMWGRPYYVAPERLRNEPEEAPSDIYSLGAVLLHALTGTPPCNGDPHGLNVLEMIERGNVRWEEPAAPLHEKTAALLERMLAPEPLQRFQHWDEVAAQLTQAGTMVARRDAAAAPVQSPPPPKEPARPNLPPPEPARSSVWIVALLIGLCVLGGLVAWKFRAGLSRPASSPETSTPAGRP